MLELVVLVAEQMAALNLLVLVQQQILVVAAAVLVLLELRAHLSLAVLAALA
jgi:hypothetical protein